MALLEEMQILVGDLEAAFSRRAGDERERHAVAAQDAHERAAQLAGRQAEVAGMLGELYHGRLAQTVQDARERAGDERERLAVAAQDAHERAAEMFGLAKIWTGHATAMGGLRGGAFRPAMPKHVEAVRRTFAESAPAPAKRKTAPAAATHKPAKPASAAATRKPAKPAPAKRKPAKSAPAAATRRPGKSAPAAATRKPAKPAAAAAKRKPTAAAVVRYLAARPGGVKLTELGAHFSSSRIVLGRILNEMIAGKMVRRDAKLGLYFAA